MECFIALIIYVSHIVIFYVKHICFVFYIMVSFIIFWYLCTVIKTINNTIFIETRYMANIRRLIGTFLYLITVVLTYVGNNNPSNDMVIAQMN